MTDFSKYKKLLAWVEKRGGESAVVANCEDLREIVDSQIQKIAEQTEKIQSFSDEFIAMLTVERELQGKLADQSQKIEAMQKQLNAYSLLTAAVSLMQKQYTEEEMRHAFEDPENRDPVHDSEVERNEHGEYKDRLVEVAWFNFMRCARFLGAIKEKEE